MIITRTPFRVSFLGGGTDLPWFFREHGGSFISLAIDKYIYLSLHPMFDTDQTLLKYAKTEMVSDIGEIKHPIVRELFRLRGISGVDLGVSSDIPAGTGLGSSSSFTVGLIKLLNEYQGLSSTKHAIAEEACHIELDLLSEPIGIQDQYAASFGGLNYFQISRDGNVVRKPIELDYESQKWLDSSMLLVRVGNSVRSASAVLEKQKQYAATNDVAVQGLISLRELTDSNYPRINSDIRNIGALLKDAWELKRQSNPLASNAEIDSMVERGIAAGALGAKLLGAGAGGFVLFVCDPNVLPRLKDVFKIHKMIQPALDANGSRTIYRN